MIALQRFILLCFLSASLLAQSPDMGQLFPLHSGDSWTYATTHSAGMRGTHTVEVVDKLYSSWYQVEGLPFGDGYPRWYARSSTVLYQWRGYYAPMVDLDVPVGTPEPLSALAADLRNASVTLEDDDAVISVPAGTWSGCHVYSVQTSTGEGLSSFTLAPGAGLIAYTVGDAQGETDHALKAATIDGAVYPKVRGASLALTTDRLSYAADATGTVSMRVRFEVGTLGDPLTLHFTSGQRYDISVAAASNPFNTLWTWSANKMFIMATASLQVVPGAPQVFETSFDVPGLSAGKYILRMQLVGSDPFATEVPFTVTGGATSAWPAPSPAGSFLSFADPDPANGWNVGDEHYVWNPLATIDQGVLSKANGAFSATGLPSMPARQEALLKQAIVDIWDLALVWRYDDGSSGPEGTLSLGSAGNAGYFEIGTHTRAQDGLDYNVVRWEDIDDNRYTLYYLPSGSGYALKARQYDN